MSQELFNTFGPDIGELALIPGPSGTFKVVVNGGNIII
jgi:predicted Rdx family selenoprotein